MSCQKDCMLIGIAGGTGSGKSTFTNRIKKQFGDDVTVIYHDNYYRRRDDIPFEERKKINYDHPDALETDMLIEHIKQLKAGKSVVCPVYDFSVHNRSDKTVVINDENYELWLFDYGYPEVGIDSEIARLIDEYNAANPETPDSPDSENATGDNAGGETSGEKGGASETQA